MAFSNAAVPGSALLGANDAVKAAAAAASSATAFGSGGAVTASCGCSKCAWSGATPLNNGRSGDGVAAAEAVAAFASMPAGTAGSLGVVCAGAAPVAGSVAGAVAGGNASTAAVASFVGSVAGAGSFCAVGAASSARSLV